ncbi:MAG: 23S rRNA (pseudouridine(1915)-N(3))-methyltransferase RlmH [Clostridia bacterium]|nr:23S rRNA (pseudouridine(1915)-N(3))-methyltransferase RlmH [Clostridia bacterium]
MVQLTIISVGALASHFKDSVAEYEKRLSQFCTVNDINIKECRIADEDDKTQIENALSLEGDKILAKIPQGAYKIALCVEGASPDSVKLAEIIGRASDERGKICLIIGSSHGLCDKVKNACDYRLSVSKLTFPHQLMRVILSESLYRSFAIINNKRYHK